MKNFSKLEWISIIFIVVIHGGFLVMTPFYFLYHAWNWIAFFVGIFLYIISAMGVTAGYHRFFSHKTYQAHPVVEIVYLFLGCL